MKNNSKPKLFTFGDLVAGIYGACDRRRAVGLLRLAVNAGVLVLPGQRQVAMLAAKA